ncbi:HdeD family acid-resistance protein [Agromyces sp. SYSU T00266]|uniref:HdeD family acid-resistance protein n=1 Tax=Agromyces zhanjiangensis TaxID=3158562 RepID=UPI00339470B2
MSSPQSNSMFAAFAFDSAELTKSAVNSIRIALGVSGVIALIIGVFITFWPKNSAVVLTVMLAIYFLVAGLAYIGIGIFSRSISGGARALDIILGVLFLFGAVVMFANPTDSAVVIGIFLGILVGVLWIVEGVVALAQSGNSSSRGWSIFFGLLSIVAGIVLLFSPLWGVVILFVVTGIALIVLGIVQIVRAFTFGRGMQLSS